MLIGAGYILFTQNNPDFSLPWEKWTSYGIYGLYAVYVIMVIVLPRIKEDWTFASCIILGAQMIAIDLIMITFGTVGQTYLLAIAAVLALVSTSATQSVKRGNEIKSGRL